MDLRKMITVPLLSAIFAIVGWITPSLATNLKDIRIGEYDAFTRIVFEFDTPISLNDSFIESTGRLTLVFPHTEPDLVRKIPFERSDRIKEIQLWNRKNSLSSVVLFDFNNFRFQSFELASPYRLAIDIYPISESVTPNIQPTLDDPTDKANQSNLLDNNNQLSSLPVTDQAGVLPEPDSSELPREEAQISSESDVVETKKNVPDSNKIPLQEEIKPVIEIAAPNTLSPTLEEDVTNNYTAQLQYYLMICLVFITIIILALLVLMLLTRNKWTAEKPQINSDDLFNQQDERIASLNARIHEHLKRYDEV